MSEFKIIRPCDSERITSAYGPRSSGDGFHDGVDYGAIQQGVAGDQIKAAHDGTVAMSYFSKSYGNCIIINDKNTNYSTLYAHMVDRNVAVGDSVTVGQQIGHMGTTGNSTGVHLHFEVRNRHYDDKYWNSHDGEFYSSYDPIDFLIECDDYDSDLQYLINCDIIESPDYWQELINNDDDCSEVSVKTLITLFRKTVEKTL